MQDTKLSIYQITIPLRESHFLFHFPRGNEGEWNTWLAKWEEGCEKQDKTTQSEFFHWLDGRPEKQQIEDKVAYLIKCGRRNMN